MWITNNLLSLPPLFPEWEHPLLDISEQVILLAWHDEGRYYSADQGDAHSVAAGGDQILEIFQALRQEVFNTRQKKNAINMK